MGGLRGVLRTPMNANNWCEECGHYYCLHCGCLCEHERKGSGIGVMTERP